MRWPDEGPDRRQMNAMPDWKLLRRVANGHYPSADERGQIERISRELLQKHMEHEGKICCEYCGLWRSEDRARSLDEGGWICASCARKPEDAA